MAGKIANRRPVAAVIVASVLMLMFGLAHHIVATRICAPLRKTPICSGALTQLPLKIGMWVGEEVPLDEAIERRTDADSLINRRYSRHNSQEAVTLYIACGVNSDELLRHHPENCYSGAGWLLADRRARDLTPADGTILPCTVLEFVRNRLDVERITTLMYVIVDGQVYGDIPAVRWKVWRRHSDVRYAAEVQIIASVGSAGVDMAEQIVRDFAAASFPSIARLFDSITESEDSGELRELPKAK